ncbi:hypothetical protein DPMN_103442 [Dreissena polymorpha]|nr:hypothetical protein DPMN_103442 [Dreissena polymorpha]
MSVTEDKQASIKSLKESPTEQVEGACGTELGGFRPSTPYSENGDNLSMEVRFSEGSSHHASDISSVSYQNLLDDDATGAELSRRGSEDSVDSYLQDYNEDNQKLDTACTDDYRERLSERISKQVYEKDIMKVEDRNLPKSCNSVNSDPGLDAQVLSDLQLKQLKSNSVNPPLNVQDSFRKHELVLTMRDQQRSKSLPPAEQNVAIEKKRNSLEIRNNIPVAGEVKNYQKDIHFETTSYSHGAKPKIPKQSPGLACRVEENTLNEEGKRIMDSNATQIINDLIQVSKANAAALNKSLKENNDDISESLPHTCQTVTGSLPPTDIVNEYEYVKYSRIQEGNSYIGMRLAYSSSESDGHLQKSVDGGLEDMHSGADIGDPENHLGGFFSPDSHVGHVNVNINEDVLTEIPLNGPELGEDGKAFTLSPENTDCESLEIESVVSEGDSETRGMPNVEDGLSSSQTSDNEENVRSEHNTPKKMLQKRQQEEVERKLYGVECAAMKPLEMDAEAIMDDLKMKREALDHAISEIKNAIRKSKGVSLEPPSTDDAEDPIWIKR